LRHPLHQHEPAKLAKGLQKSISLAEATVYGLGIIFGAGIYALIGEAAGIAGNMVWLSFVFSAFVASLTALSYCELSSLFPKSAAEYVYVKSAFNSNLLGFMMGWISMFAALITISAVSLGFAGYFNALFGVPVILTAVALIAILSIVNFLGAKESTKLNLVLTLVATLGLLLIIMMAIPFFGSVDYFESPVQGKGLLPSLNSVAVAAALIFFAYLGFEDIANISEETVDAKNAVPKAILLALVISTVLYVLVSVSVVSVVPWQQLSASSAPISLVAGKILGEPGTIVFSVIALFATSSTVLIVLVAVSRLLYGISSDHGMPEVISKVHSRTGVPFVSIAITSLLAMVFVLIGDLKEVAYITNFGVFVLFLMVNLAVIMLRLRGPEVQGVFKIPWSIGKVPLLPVLGALFSLFMISRVETSSAVFGSVVILLGVPAYFVLAMLK